MNSNRLIWFGMFAGGFIGGIIPMFWGASTFSMSSIFLAAIGGFLGIWFGYKLSRHY